VTDPLRAATTGRLHRARPAVAAVGLERRPPYEPERLPSDRPEPCGPSGLSGARCSLASPRPAPGRSLRAWACLVKGRLVASSYLAPERRLTACARATRKMRLTDLCNRLPSRAPCGLFGSWSRRPSGPRSTSRSLVAPRVSCDARGGRWLTLGFSLAAAKARVPADPRCRMSLPSGASLDGEPPASACAAFITRSPEGVPEGALRGLCPERPRERHSTVLAGPRSTAPPRCTSRSRCFRPRAEPATSPLTSSVTTLRGSGREAASPSLRIARPAFPRRLVKDSGFVGSGRLPSPSAPSPGRAPRLRVVRVGSRGARHRCRCSRARGFCHRDPASGALSPLELPPVETRGARRLDP